MVKRELKVPYNVLQRVALLRRSSPRHPMRIEIVKDLKRYLKGYYGERECCHYLSFLPEDRYLIFHGLCLKDKKDFQMDVLLLSRNFALIIEVKNISGKLIFNKGSNQVIQEYKNEKIGLPNPIYQVKRHRIQLMNWLIRNKMKMLPVEHLVVISKTSTIIETTPDNIPFFNQLIFAEALIEKILELEKKYPNQHLTGDELSFLSDTLMEAHIEKIPDILQEYKISPSELILGVQCPCCNMIMKYISGKWRCISCNHMSKDAHLQALHDYFLLIGTTITRKEFRTFLQMESDIKAKYLLSSLNLALTGSKRGAKYNLPFRCILSQRDEKAIEKGEYAIP
jgi:hypothetical protein